jgi:hypothetical protein
MSKKEFEAVAVGSLAPKSVFTYGGVSWVVLQRIGNGILCLAEKILFEKEFDESNYNNWEDSSLREYLNNDFLEKLIDSGAEEAAFLPMVTDITADDGLKDYGSCEDIIILISCQQYRKYRGVIPNADDWWWTCTAYSTKSNGYSCSARFVNSDGTLYYYFACIGNGGVRPLCTLQSSILVSPTYKEESYTQAVSEDVENLTEAEENAAAETDNPPDAEPKAEFTDDEQKLLEGLVSCVKKAQQDYLKKGGDLLGIVNATGGALNIGRMLTNG